MGLNNTTADLSLLNEEIKLMRQGVLQNQIALDILTAAQGGNCETLKTEWCVYIRDSSSNISACSKY